MIAGGIFFMAIFAILAMVSGVLRNARSLRRVELDAGMVAAQVGKHQQALRGHSSPATSATCIRITPGRRIRYEVATNGLFQVDIVVRRRGVAPVDA